MRCSSCGEGDLVAGRFEHGLPCYLCSNCGGALLSLSPYVDWMTRQAREEATAQDGPFEYDGSDTKHAMCCPKCSRIMIKYRVQEGGSHGLDYCFGCEEVWLDRGEWDYLKAHGLHLSITAVTTDAWQRKLREQASARQREERFRAAIGPDAFEEVRRIHAWLQWHPARGEILRYLGQEHGT